MEIFYLMVGIGNHLVIAVSGSLGERISEVFQNAIDAGKPSVKANFWGYYASQLPVVAFDFTVIGTAVRNELDVHAYLDDVLRRALAGETDWATMAPHAWKAEHPESVRLYRQDERRQAADRKRVRRARRRLTNS